MLYGPVWRSAGHILHSRVRSDGRLDFLSPGHLGWRVNAYNLADKRFFVDTCNDVYAQPGSPRSILTTISWSF